MSEFPKEWILNRTDEELASDRKRAVKWNKEFYELDDTDLDFTCDKCVDRNICSCAYDLYNLQGDCLMAK